MSASSELCTFVQLLRQCAAVSLFKWDEMVVVGGSLKNLFEVQVSVMQLKMFFYLFQSSFLYNVGSKSVNCGALQFRVLENKLLPRAKVFYQLRLSSSWLEVLQLKLFIVAYKNKKPLLLYLNHFLFFTKILDPLFFLQYQSISYQSPSLFYKQLFQFNLKPYQL